jgi:hypothetical protein
MMQSYLPGGATTAWTSAPPSSSTRFSTDHFDLQIIQPALQVKTRRRTGRPANSLGFKQLARGLHDRFAKAVTVPWHCLRRTPSSE